METLQVLMLNYEYPPLGGGAGVAMQHLLQELRESDMLIDVVASSASRFREEQLTPKQHLYLIDINKNDQRIQFQSNIDLARYTIRALRFCRQLIRERGPYDLCHAFFGIPGGWIAARLNIPYIVSLRGSDVPLYNRRFRLLDQLFFRRMSRAIWRNARAVVANSDGLRSLALQTAAQQPIRVILNGVACDYFYPLPRTQKAGRIQLIAVGRLIERKGYEYLIRALKNDQRFQLTIIGEGAMLRRLAWLAKTYNASVVFLGQQSREQVRHYLQHADIFVSPSLNEGMSNAMLEAMACGLPIITTDVGGSKELVCGNGFIVPRASSQSIAQALARYRDNPEYITEHGKQSRERAEQLSWQAVVQAYKNLYREIGTK